MELGLGVLAAGPQKVNPLPDVGDAGEVLAPGVIDVEEGDLLLHTPHDVLSHRGEEGRPALRRALLDQRRG